MTEMDSELQLALAKRRLLSGDVMLTGAAGAVSDDSSLEQVQADEGLACTQIQSLLIGANQVVEGRLPDAILHFMSQIR